jgi:hypothetical protein
MPADLIMVGTLGRLAMRFDEVTANAQTEPS